MSLDRDSFTNRRPQNLGNLTLPYIRSSNDVDLKGTGMLLKKYINLKVKAEKLLRISLRIGQQTIFTDLNQRLD